MIVGFVLFQNYYNLIYEVVETPHTHFKLLKDVLILKTIQNYN